MKRLKRVPKRSALKESNEGVATTVGTIMALLVFLSLLSLITQQYVPVWMEDNEAYHSEEAMQHFSYLKGNIDNLIMNDYTDYPLYSTMRLGSEGVPMFASQTPGVIRSTPRWGGFDVTFFDGATQRSYEGQGNVSLQVLNRYFEEQTIAYEHGAIILEQPQGAVLRAPPHIRIDEYDGAYSISLTLIDISSSRRESAGGSGVVGITTELWGSTRRTYSNVTDVSFEMITAYPGAWGTWFNDTLELDGLIVDGNNIEIDFPDVTDLTVTRARVHIELST